MQKRKVTLGLATGAALILSLGFASPAVAEEPAEDLATVAVPAEITQVAQEGPSIDAQIEAAKAADEAAAAKAAAEAAEPEPEAEVEPEAEPSLEEEIIAPAIALAPVVQVTTALASTTQAVIAPAVVTGTFGNVKVSSAGNITPPNGTTPKTKNLSVTFDGPAPSSNRVYYMFDSSYYGPRVTVYKKNKGVKSANVIRPYVDGPSGQITPAAASTAKVSAYRYATPGKYKVTVPVSQRTYSPNAWNTKTATTYLTVKANAKTSKKMTSFYGSGYSGKTFKVRVTAPDYQTGAKVTVYFKAKGKSKYKKVATGKLKASSSVSKASINVSKKHNVAGKKGKIYVKIGSVTYAKGYKTGSASVK